MCTRLTIADNGGGPGTHDDGGRAPGRPVDDDLFGLQYSDESQDEEDVDIENQYYNSKGLLETNPREALTGFRGVVQMELESAAGSSDGGKGEWGFKALKQVVKIRYRLNENKEMLDDYRCGDTRHWAEAVGATSRLVLFGSGRGAVGTNTLLKRDNGFPVTAGTHAACGLTARLSLDPTSARAGSS